MIHQSDNFVNLWVVAIVVVLARVLGTSAYLQSAHAIIISVKIKREKRNGNKSSQGYLWKLQKNKKSSNFLIKTLPTLGFMLKVYL